MKQVFEFCLQYTQELTIEKNNVDTMLNKIDTSDPCNSLLFWEVIVSNGQHIGGWWITCLTKHDQIGLSRNCDMKVNKEGFGNDIAVRRGDFQILNSIESIFIDFKHIYRYGCIASIPFLMLFSTPRVQINRSTHALFLIWNHVHPYSYSFRGGWPGSGT